MNTLEEKLEGYYGTESYHRLTLTPILATDGVVAFATIGNAFWAVSDMCIEAMFLKEEFLSITITSTGTKADIVYTFVPFGVAVDEFQHIVYENPDMTPNERKTAWRELEKKYMPWRDYGEDNAFFESGGWWYHKLHIYQFPFYYINYTLTTMGAMEFKAKQAENPSAWWEDYLTLCSVGGSLGYLDTLKAAHLSVPFEKDGVKRAVSQAKSILENALKEGKL